MTDPTVDFAANFISSFDLTLTDHNRVLNNGALVLRNTEWTASFLAKWAKFSARGKQEHVPFTDNGSFIETIISYVEGWTTCFGE